MAEATMPLRALILPAMACLVACGANGDGRESPGSKREWSILQGIEYQHRSHPLVTPIIRHIAGYDVLGLHAPGCGHNVWVMLWPTHPPFYKQMPQENFVISRREFEAITGAHMTSSTVDIALASHVGKVKVCFLGSDRPDASQDMARHVKPNATE